MVNTNHKYTNSDSVRMCIDFSIHDFQYAHVSLVLLKTKKVVRMREIIKCIYKFYNKNNIV